MTNRTYTEAEENALIAAELANARIGEMERRIADAAQSNLHAIAELKEQIERQTALIQRLGTENSEGAKLLREELKRDYVSAILFKSAIDALEKRIDSNWQRLVLIGGTLTTFGLILQWGFSMVNAARPFIK